MEMSDEKDLCPFCRTPNAKTDEENIKRVTKLMEVNNAQAFYMLAYSYHEGRLGMQRDRQKANELLLKAGELGHAQAYHNLGISYSNGFGVELDMNKAKYYWELAAMMGDTSARHNLGSLEGQAGNHRRAFRHYMISAKGGYDDSLGMVKKGFMNGNVTKDEYASTLRAYHERQKEMKSDERDKASIYYALGLGRLELI